MKRPVEFNMSPKLLQSTVVPKKETEHKVTMQVPDFHVEGKQLSRSIINDDGNNKIMD